MDMSRFAEHGDLHLLFRAPRIRGDDPGSGACGQFDCNDGKALNERQAVQAEFQETQEGKRLFGIAARGLPGYVEAYGKRIDVKTVWDVVRKIDGRSGEDIRLCTCFGAVRTRTGGR